MIELTDFLSDIPVDPEAGLTELHGRLITAYSAAPENSKEEEEARELYVVVVHEWVKSRKMDELVRLPDIDKYNLDNETSLKTLFTQTYKAVETFVKGVRRNTIREEVRNAIGSQGVTIGYTRLSPDEKKEIHEYLGRIRKIIDESDIGVRKKNALFNKINELAAEVDKAGTKTDGFLGFLLEVSLVAGQMGKNSAPLMKEVKEMVKTIARSRAKEENVLLPSDEDISLITDESNS